MIKRDSEELAKAMTDRLTERCHVANYEKYKIWLEKIEKQREELFWRARKDYVLDTDYFDDVDYAYEINQLEWLWFEDYLDDISTRWIFDNIPDDDDDRR